MHHTRGCRGGGGACCRARGEGCNGAAWLKGAPQMSSWFARIGRLLCTLLNGFPILQRLPDFLFCGCPSAGFPPLQAGLRLTRAKLGMSNPNMRCDWRVLRGALAAVLPPLLALAFLRACGPSQPSGRGDPNEACMSRVRHLPYVGTYCGRNRLEEAHRRRNASIQLDFFTRSCLSCDATAGTFFVVSLLVCRVKRSKHGL
jgi:hypothetical protein